MRSPNEAEPRLPCAIVILDFHEGLNILQTHFPGSVHGLADKRSIIATKWNLKWPLSLFLPMCLLKWKSLSCVWLFATPWTIQSMEFSRPEYWSGKPFPSPADLPDPGVKPGSPALQADSLPTESSSGPGGKRLSEIGHFNLQSATISSIVTALYVIICSVMSDPLWLHGLYSLPHFSIHGILQARILEWVAMPTIFSSRRSSQPRDQTRVSCISHISRQNLYHC